MGSMHQALSGICKESGQGECDWRIWRNWREESGVRGDGGSARAVAMEEAAEPVLTAVFLTPDSVDRLSSAIPFVRESADLELRLIVNDCSEASGRCIGPLDDQRLLLSRFVSTALYQCGANMGRDACLSCRRLPLPVWRRGIHPSARLG